MEYSGKTPRAAVDRAQSWLAIEHKDRPDLAGGQFYAVEYPNHHPMRRFVGGYVKSLDGKSEQRIRDNSNIVDGVYLIKSDLNITSWRHW